ncbi:YihY/virulence factor BrkB family protein [Parasediminibacterium sp. JCM 36343]|uniref:YihY/virulence factor BrkB family protein n=1 Tax=Parasediminibacterium sp. JCM 36343 TaxID=3374279 RepID=UPI003979DC8C
MTKLERILFRLPPIAFLMHQAKIMAFPGLESISIYEVVVYFQKQVKKVGLIERASAISFNLIMALPAALLFLFSIVPYLPDSDGFENQIMGLFKDITPNSNTYTFIKNILEDLLQKHVGVFSSGFILLIFYASNAMMGIIRTFDKSIQENKAFFMHRRWRAIVLTMILILLVIASATLLVGQDRMGVLLKQLFHMKRKAKIQGWNVIRWVILVVFLFCGISFIYKFAPSVKKRWPLVTTGSVMATVLTLITTLFFSYWVNNFASYNKVYGSIGTVIIIMLLIYLNALILLIGFELNVSIVNLLAQKGKSTHLKSPFLKEVA